MPGRMPQQIAVAFALCAFVVALGVGLVCDIAPATVLVRAMVVLIASYPIGRALGVALGVALNEHLTTIVSANPTPEPVRVRTAVTETVGDVDIIEDVESL